MTLNPNPSPNRNPNPNPNPNPNQDLEQLYSAAPLGSAFDWAARSRAAQGGDAAAMGGAALAASRRASTYQSGSACRVLPT